MTYLITGATGDVGARVVQHLLERGVRPRILARNEAKARLLFGDRVDLFLGDLSEPDSLRTALHGVDALYLVNVGPQIPERDQAAASISKEMEVKKIVKLSSLDVDHGLAIGAWHEGGEAAIRASRVPFIFVRPTGFMSNLLAWANSIKMEQIVRSSTADGRRPFIHSEDIAAVSVEGLVTDTYLGWVLPITGPQSLTFGEATAIIAKAIGHPLKYEAISDDEARERYAKISGSPEETEAHVVLWRAIREGRLASVTRGVAQILGRQPISLSQWAKENADAFGQ
jgi:(4-alkanoyl-5-oxo-2,5-dihydrofuran-3-yl)methyl phosphate reductase